MMSIPEGAVFEKVRIDNIEATAATQVRVKISKEMVDQYTEDFQNGADFPPLIVYREKNTDRNILADGFHRHRAAINAGREDIGCYIYEGGMREALIEALGANSEHGFRRTNADKRHAVEMALKDPEISQLTQQEIADICRVTRRTVGRIVNESLTSPDEDGENGTKSHSKKPEKPKPGDVRDNGKEPTQEEVDLEVLREAMKLIKHFAYDGDTAAEKLKLSKDDVADCEYASTWLANIVISMRAPKAEEEA